MHIHTQAHTYKYEGVTERFLGRHTCQNQYFNDQNQN